MCVLIGYFTEKDRFVGLGYWDPRGNQVESPAPDLDVIQTSAGNGNVLARFEGAHLEGVPDCSWAWR